MSIANFLYRQKQKWNYHTARNDFERIVADINRHEKRIILKEKHFKIPGCLIEFEIECFGFIVERFDLFLKILEPSNTEVIINSDRLLYKTGDLIMEISNAEEIYIIHEIFINKCYEVTTEFEFNVIDIGMNVGYASLFFAQNKKIKKIYGYEPFKPTYKEALSNFNLNENYKVKITPLNIGLGAVNDVINTKYNNCQKGKNTISNKVSGQVEEVHIKCADEIIQSVIQLNPDTRFLVKMDCEGSEFDIFERYKNKLIPIQLFGFIIEWHYKNPQFIIDILVSNSFKVHKTTKESLGIITAFR